MGMTTRAEEQRAALTLLLTACGIVMPEYPSSDGSQLWQHDAHASGKITAASHELRIQLLNANQSFFVAEQTVQLFDARSDTYYHGFRPYPYFSIVMHLTELAEHTHDPR